MLSIKNNKKKKLLASDMKLLFLYIKSVDGSLFGLI